MAPGGVIISAAMVALVLLANLAAGVEVHMTYNNRARQQKAKHEQYINHNQMTSARMCSMSKEGECEAEMMSGVKRLLLQTTSTSSYISYGALTADTVPCSTAGASYYSCTSSSAANPYTRSCTTITDCARDTS